MTDEELIDRLREIQGQAGLFASAAANRIAALVKDKERLGRELNMARYGQPDFASKPDFVWAIHKQAMADIQARAERLEAALRVARAHVANNADGWSVSRGAARDDLTIVDAALTQKDRTDG